MATRFEWRDKPITIKNAKRADPQRIGEELTRITMENGGDLRPHLVREAARNRRNVLHRHFEWDNQVAAESFRLDQARELIRMIKAVEITDDGQEQYSGMAFVSITDPKAGRVYKRLSDVMTNTRLQVRVMDMAVRDLEAWERRYAELEDVCSLVRVARERLTSRRTEIEERDRPH